MKVALEVIPHAQRGSIDWGVLIGVSMWKRLVLGPLAPLLDVGIVFRRL